MVVRSQSSAAGVLALLQEPDLIFKQHALTALNPLVPQFWAEISEHIALMSVSSFDISCSILIHVTVNHSTNRMIFPKKLVILLLFSRVKSTIT